MADFILKPQRFLNVNNIGINKNKNIISSKKEYKNNEHVEEDQSY